MQKKLPIGIENFEDMIKEVKEILQYHKVPEAFEQTKKWYDGYHFGNTDIYCPWDVINHCRALKVESDATPQPYWINTSGNSSARSSSNRFKNGLKKPQEKTKTD